MPPRRKDYQQKPDSIPEVQRLLQVLKMSMKVLGFTNRDVERKLGLSGSYLSRLFSGLIELRVEHVVKIARVIGVEPDEIFQIAYPKRSRPSSSAAAHLYEALGGKPAGGDEEAPVAPAASPETEVGAELEHALEKMMARSLQKILNRMG
jgi:transcriptional regulator with XRE-family HTH domain